MNEHGLKCRLVFSGVLLMLAIVGLGFRLAFLHVWSHDKKNIAKRDFRREIMAERGHICDRKGNENILALDLAVKDVCVDPSVIISSNRVADVAGFLSKQLFLPLNEVTSRVSRPKRRFAYIKRFVTEDVATTISEEQLPGVFFRDMIVRNYPCRSFMSHVLGFVNHEGQGSSGIEQVMDKYLRGSPGMLESCMNAKRQELYGKRGRVVPALGGAHVVLTLDQNIQHMVEKALEKAVAKHGAQAGWIIVQKVKTGEILAMASWPWFDLNNFRESTDEQRLNRCIGSVYEPGSTMKAMVIAAVLNEKVATPETRVDCENGYWFHINRPLRDSHGYGFLTVADILKKSSNIGTAKLALRLGPKRLHRYMKNFGFRQKTGIELPGEERGILMPVRKWPAIKTSRVSIGQGIAVTALQILNAFCAIANDGYLMKPHVVKEVVSAGGTVLFRNEPEVLGQPISTPTAQVMCKMLQRVTEQGGTGRRACVDGYDVAGKTGTAQKAVAGGYSDTAYTSSFVGFLPADSPELGIVVVMDEPQPVHYGGTVAAPAFSAIATDAVRYLDIPAADYKVAGNL